MGLLPIPGLDLVVLCPTPSSSGKGDMSSLMHFAQTHSEQFGMKMQPKPDGVILRPKNMADWTMAAFKGNSVVVLLARGVDKALPAELGRLLHSFGLEQVINNQPDKNVRVSLFSPYSSINP